ncbi:MAG: family 10 glycosylhydrolase, partial [Proteobacteria bacterium]|nr:family 10 glycosylhydrolase [Pseudomonadota bacterium]
MITILDRCESNNFNAIVFQIRASGDAFYNSKYEPWSWYLTGEQGRAPKGNWDPLTFVIEEAHDRGLEVHCWFNPYRANHPAQKGRLSNRHLARTNPSVVKSFGDYMWMDPGEKEVQDHSFNVFMDVVERYDVDGIHIDDYFYPYPSYGKGADFPDDPSWNRYVDSGGRLNRGDWRRQNVDTFVERVYKGIKQRKPWVKFGISPFGIARANTPEGVKATFDQYEVLYADAVKWIEQGWCDYFTPQLYWPIEGDQSFRLLLKYWQGHNPKGIHLWPGGIPSNLNRSRNAWSTKEVADQIRLTRAMGAGGNAHFSRKAFTLDYRG